MPHLRLRKPDERETLDPIPFPDLNRFARRDEPRPADLRLAERVDEALDRVQDDLNALREEADRVFHLPGSDDWPPSAA